MKEGHGYRHFGSYDGDYSYTSSQDPGGPATSTKTRSRYRREKGRPGKLPFLLFSFPFLFGRNVRPAVLNRGEVTSKGEISHIQGGNDSLTKFKGEIQISKIFKIQKKWKMTRCPLISAEAMKLLLPFSTTYLCESGFSAAVAMKTKARIS